MKKISVKKEILEKTQKIEDLKEFIKSKNGFIPNFDKASEEYAEGSDKNLEYGDYLDNYIQLLGYVIDRYCVPKKPLGKKK